MIKNRLTSFLIVFLIILAIVELSLLIVINSKRIQNLKEKFLSDVPTTKDRIEHYLGNLNKPYTISPKDITPNMYIIDSTIFDSNNYNGKKVTKDNYLNEMEEYFNHFKMGRPFDHDIKFIMIPGDVHLSTKHIPVLTKTRPIDDPGLNVILPLNNERHWNPILEVPANDIPWEQKTDKIIWRGVATGRDKRISLVEKYYNYSEDKIDVGFTKWVSYYKGKQDNKLLKQPVTMHEQLKCKYIISIEGNDVATNLKWILTSNSVCIMPKPTVESWLMEGNLIPWYHYVPVKSDWSDLEKIYKWCINNQEKCKQIVRNANEYMKMFDSKSNIEIINKILENYTNFVKFKN